MQANNPKQQNADIRQIEMLSAGSAENPLNQVEGIAGSHEEGKRRSCSMMQTFDKYNVSEPKNVMSAGSPFQIDLNVNSPIAERTCRFPTTHSPFTQSQEKVDQTGYKHFVHSKSRMQKQRQQAFNNVFFQKQQTSSHIPELPAESRADLSTFQILQVQSKCINQIRSTEESWEHNKLVVRSDRSQAKKYKQMMPTRNYGAKMPMKIWQTSKACRQLGSSFLPPATNKRFRHNAFGAQKPMGQQKDNGVLLKDVDQVLSEQMSQHAQKRTQSPLTKSNHNSEQSFKHELKQQLIEGPEPSCVSTPKAKPGFDSNHPRRIQGFPSYQAQLARLAAKVKGAKRGSGDAVIDDGTQILLVSGIKPSQNLKSSFGVYSKKKGLEFDRVLAQPKESVTKIELHQIGQIDGALKA